MSFPIQFNSVSAYYITSPLIKKPKKDLGFKDVGRGIFVQRGTHNYCVYLFVQKSLLCPCVLLLKGISVYYHA